MKTTTDNFIMPPFARMQWASKQIKEKYEPLWRKAIGFYWIMEKLTVEHGIRDCTTEHIRHEDYISQSKQLLDKGLLFFPIQRVGHYQGFSYYHPPAVDGKPWSYYGAIAREVEKGRAFEQASHNMPDGAGILGELLGYPDCCSTDYVEYTKMNTILRDRTWRNAANADEKYIAKKEDNLIELKNFPWQANSLLHNFSLGAIFHSECKLGCESTLENAKKWYDLAEKLNVPGLKEVEMFLRMPIEWDSAKGIAYIKTPLFKASVNSNMTAERYQVRIQGSYYPEDAIKGLEFPWDVGTRFATVAKEGNKLTYDRGDIDETAGL